MDNLTHSLAGALLGQMGLKRLSGRAMPTLILAANLPDIDGLAMLLGTEGLAIRRGITHGPLAMLLLPPLLVGLVLAWERWRPLERGPPLRAGPLLLLAYIATLSHPALDWLNSYGIRLLEPFSSRWLYGDTLFIIDVWIWIALAAGYWISRRRERLGRRDWRRPGVAAFAAIAAYILASGLISARAEAIASDKLHAAGIRPTMIVANPRPLTFWSRRMLWRTERVHGAGEFGLLAGVQLGTASPTKLDSPALAAALGRPDVRAFLFWSRMPLVVEQDGRAFLADQRFSSSLASDRFRVPLDSPPRSP
jgi:inner membrane protein